MLVSNPCSQQQTPLGAPRWPGHVVVVAVTLLAHQDVRRWDAWVSALRLLRSIGHENNRRDIPRLVWKPGKG